MPSKKEENKKNMFREFLSSAGAGVAVSYLTFPLEGYKKYLVGGLKNQKFYPFKGSTIFAANIIPTTTMQLMTDGFLKNHFKENSSISTNVIISSYCGIQGAIVATLVENCIIRQQVLNCGPKAALKDMFSHGYLRPWKSYRFIATRDGVFTLFMLQINPSVKQYVREHSSNNNLYEFIASLWVGFIGAFLSHPFDTMATRMQKTHEKMSLRSTINDVLTNLGGYKGFYVGFPYRVGLFFTFSNVIPAVKDMLENFLSNANLKDKTLESEKCSTENKLDTPTKNLTFHYSSYKNKAIDANAKKSLSEDDEEINNAMLRLNLC
jgi:hypothetical protein